MSNLPAPRYSLWQAVSTALAVASRAVEEVRALAREPGPQGEKGRDGSPGKLPIVKAWVEGIHYEGAVVAHSGATYQATKDTANEPGHADWICLAARGNDGLTPNIRGTFVRGVSYKRMDVVALNGGSFIAHKDDPGSCPGPDWQLIASPGKRGEKGITGDRGERGHSNTPEPPAILVGWKHDLKAYTATPVLSDGTEGEVLNIRLFLEQFLIERGL